MFTQDGVEITDGLPVFTNNLDAGYVRLDRLHNDGWFDVEVVVRYDGKPIHNFTMQDASRLTTQYVSGNGKRRVAEQFINDHL